MSEQMYCCYILLFGVINPCKCGKANFGSYPFAYLCWLTPNQIRWGEEVSSMLFAHVVIVC
jgi:hypothetical protein